MYHNFIFDLYGTLVDIHTNEKKPSLWKKLALFYSFQGAAYTGQELRRRYRQLEAAARTAPSPYACPEICAADIFRTLYTEKGIQPTEALLTATGQFFRIESLNTLQCYPASIDTLQNLHTKGCGVYLLSNAQRIFTEYELRSLGLWELFDGILISSDEGCCKPDPPDRILITRKLISPDVFFIHAKTATQITTEIMEPVRNCIRDAPQFFPRHALPPGKSVPSLVESGSSSS